MFPRQQLHFQSEKKLAMATAYVTKPENLFFYMWLLVKQRTLFLSILGANFEYSVDYIGWQFYFQRQNGFNWDSFSDKPERSAAWERRERNKMSASTDNSARWKLFCEPRGIKRQNRRAFREYDKTEACVIRKKEKKNNKQARSSQNV